MGIDVTTEVEIDRPRQEVSEYAADPTNATEWYRDIESIDWRTDPPVRVGSRMDFVARFLGKRLAYTYEVAELVPGERLVMRTTEGPFPMETTYTWEDAGPGRTRICLRNRGGAGNLFTRLTAPLSAAAVRRATSRNLRDLKALLESRR